MTPVLLWAALGAASVPAEPLTAEQVIARHVESIGTPAARAAAGGRVMKGMVTYIRKPTEGGAESTFAVANTNITVPFVLAAGGPRVLLDMRYGWKEYPFDRIVHDGKKVKTARMVSPGRYLPLAALLTDYTFLLKNGLIGGPLTTGWALLDTTRFDRLKYAGLKKLAGAPAHRLDARLKSEPEHDLAFFFDPETFRLLRTEIWIGPQGRHHIEEDFTDYQVVHDVALPHAWRMVLDAPSNVWEYALADFSFAAELPEEAFVVE
jgi:hypothetical protein